MHRFEIYFHILQCIRCVVVCTEQVKCNCEEANSFMEEVICTCELCRRVDELARVCGWEICDVCAVVF